MTPVDLRAAREALGLTQTALAERLGVPQATIWRWETGKHRIEHPKILALAMRCLRLGMGPQYTDDSAWPDH